MDARQQFGKGGETWAENFLAKRGYEVLATNYRAPIGEIDLICKDGDALVFVEVKTRHDETLGRPEEAVGPRKQAKLFRVAEWYLEETGYRGDFPVRFDVVSIVKRPDPAAEPEITLFPDAFSR